MRRGALAVAATLSLTSLGSASAQAADGADRALAGAITFEPGATCLEQSRVETQVAAWLGRDRIPADVRVDVQGSDRDPRAVVFRIWRGGKPHERRFDRLPETCDDATAVLGLAIALAVDASVLAGAFAPPPPVEPRMRFVSAELASGVEVVPGASAGASVGLEYGVTSWLSARADLGAQFSFANAIAGTDGTFDAALGNVTPQACAGGPVNDRFRLELCSGASFGVVHAQGHGFAVSRSATGLWAVAQGGARLIVSTGISWVLDAEGIFPLYVPVFVAKNGAGTLEQRALSPPGALLSLGPVFFF